MPRHLSFSKSLVLNRFLLSHFGVYGFEPLSEILKSSAYEGRDENNISNFYHELKQRLFSTSVLTEDQLLEYDQNIVKHTLWINHKRTYPIDWKYFQYLSLLFTEIYLDKFFRSRTGLLTQLNEYLDKWNNPNDDSVPNRERVTFEPFQYDEINKLAFWNATGSGKTLLMHINILQYEYWRKYHKVADANKILLVTPNEGLSKQHLIEFKASGIPSNIFSTKAGTAFSETKVEILEISKLAEKRGDKTVDFESFETNNLVLVDEGHRGVAGDVWKLRRDYLSKDGFAFEYSATFGQAVAAAGGRNRDSLVNEYAKTIIFNYSYKYFSDDGYGKDYHILNLKEDNQENFVRKYLTGALLSFYQQKLVFREHPETVNQFMLANPLWIFVGGTVTKSLSVSDAADIPKIIKFFQWFISQDREATGYLELLLDGNDGVIDQNNRSIFKNFFQYVRKKDFTPSDLYKDILKSVFNTTLSGANLYVNNLKGIDGELGIRVGDSDYFGVINIGADKDLYKICQEEGIPGLVMDFGESLFHGIRNDDSKINVLIGAKKFTEGWSSWRVSTMGLMNVGRSEGSQIIQLFGRGVRLKGFNWTLKRSHELDEYERPQSKIPHVTRYLETLNIFGIRSDYMEQFKEFLDKEGLPTNDSTYQTIKVPILPQISLDDFRLKMLTVKEGVDFKRDIRLYLEPVLVDQFKPVVLDWSPKVDVLRHSNVSTQNLVEDINRCVVTEDHIAFVDWDKIYFDLQNFKNERRWYNISISKGVLKDIILQSWWYELYVPEDETKITNFTFVNLWEEIVVSLLKAYIVRFYNYYKSYYLSKHMKTEWLTPDHPNFEQEYEVMVQESQERIIENVVKFADIMRQSTFEGYIKLSTDFEALNFLRHLYKPLLYINQPNYNGIVKISPVALMESEWRFLKHLRHYYNNNPDQFEDTHLCLLRNQSRKGVGFFEANGFYPDFILWLVQGDTQHIAFIDPKGLRQITGFQHPKIRFYKTIKEEIEPRLEDKSINLSSFIITNTKYHEVKHWDGGHDINQFNSHNVYFMEEQKGTYIETILGKMVK